MVTMLTLGLSGPASNGSVGMPLNRLLMISTTPEPQAHAGVDPSDQQQRRGHQERHQLAAQGRGSSCQSFGRGNGRVLRLAWRTG